MTEQEYEMTAESIATAIWEKSTGNGRDLDEDMHDSHWQNCYDAVANTYVEGIDVDEWMARALKRVA